MATSRIRKRNVTRSLPSDERGLTLLEIVVSFGVLGIILAGLMQLGSGSVRSDARSRDYTAAKSLAAEKLEELKAEPYSALVAGSYGDPSALSSSGLDDDDGGIFHRSWVVTPVSMTVGSTPIPAMQLQVFVDWDGGGRAEVITMRVDPGAINTSPFGTIFPTVAETSWRQVR